MWKLTSEVENLKNIINKKDKKKRPFEIAHHHEKNNFDHEEREVQSDQDVSDILNDV